MREIYNIGFIITRLLASVMLIMALGKQTYGYYKLLRVVVFGVSSYGAYFSIKPDFIGWAWIFGIICFLFNPFFPIRLGREIWPIVNLAVAAIFIISIFSVRILD